MKWLKRWLLKGLIKELDEHSRRIREQIWTTERFAGERLDYLDSEKVLDDLVDRLKRKQL